MHRGLPLGVTNRDSTLDYFHRLATLLNKPCDKCGAYAYIGKGFLMAHCGCACAIIWYTPSVDSLGVYNQVILMPVPVTKK